MSAEKKPLEPVYYRKELAKSFGISTRTLQTRLDELYLKHPNYSSICIGFESIRHLTDVIGKICRQFLRKHSWCVV